MREKQEIKERKAHKKEAERINNMETELQMLEESPQVNIHPDGFKATLKKISNWKTPSHGGIHGFWFKKNHLKTRQTE